MIGAAPNEGLILPSISLRIALTPDRNFGPGKADLLQAIRDTGSIAAAGRRMDISYKHAWYMLERLNSSFCEPLVIAAKGGRNGGGAQLTPTGHAVLDTYRRVEALTAQAAADEVTRLLALVKPASD